MHLFYVLLEPLAGVRIEEADRLVGQDLLELLMAAQEIFSVQLGPGQLALSAEAALEGLHILPLPCAFLGCLSAALSA